MQPLIKDVLDDIKTKKDRFLQQNPKYQAVDKLLGSKSLHQIYTDVDSILDLCMKYPDNEELRNQLNLHLDAIEVVKKGMDIMKYVPKDILNQLINDIKQEKKDV